MSKSEVYMFPDGFSRTGGTTSSIDPALLLLLNNNGGFGGGNFMWILFLFFLWPLLRNGGVFGGNGMFGGGGCGTDCTQFVSNLANNQTGRELLAQGIQGNKDAIDNLASMLGCKIGDVQTVLSQIMSKVGDMACETKLSAQQVVNAVERGDSNLAAQLASCCCDLKGAIKDVAIGTERGFSSLAYENAQGRCEIKQAIADATQQIVAGQKDAEMRELNREIAALRESKSDLKFQLSQEHQTNAFGQMIGQAVAPIMKSLNDFDNRLGKIECNQPEVAKVPYIPAAGNYIPVQYGVNFGLYGGDCGYYGY